MNVVFYSITILIYITKIRKDEINLDTLYQFIDVLKKIEDGILDQHEASFMVGTLLKKMYVDSAIKKADKINEQYDDNKEDETIAPTPVEISWKEFKSLKKCLNILCIMI